MARFSQVRGPPSKKMNRKEKRKAERKLKKARRAAFNEKKFDLIKNLKDVDSVHKFEKEQRQTERKKFKETKKNKEKKIAKKEAESARIQGLRLAIKKDDKELKLLEKNLKFRKKKGKANLPSSFSNDGLDYILDATDSEKIKDFDDLALAGPLLEGHDVMSESENSEDELTNLDSSVSVDVRAKAKKSILKSSDEEIKVKSVKFAEDFNSPSEDEDSNTDFVDEDSEEQMEMSDDLELDDEDSYMPSDDEVGSVDKKTEGLKSDLKEDIYGRLRDKEGNIVQTSGTGSYIPPAKRAQMVKSQGNDALKKKLKGFVNRISEGTMQALSSQIESLYLDHSRADVNETLCSLIMEAVISLTLSPERLVQELAMLIAILHSNVGSEVGAFFLQNLIVRFDDLLSQESYGPGSTMDNVITLLANLYNFKIVHSNLMIDVLNKMINCFKERDIELLLLILKSIGFTLRKDNPAQLKQVILDIQSKARAEEGSGVEQMQSRIRFILDILTALRNNNMNKIPGYNPTHLEHLRKVTKTMIRGHNLGDNQLNIGLEDFLKAEKQGRWWIVGSAWEGRSLLEADVKEAKSKTESFTVSGISKQMLKLAKRQGMNTDIRRHVFCILGTSEDFEDAFTRLLRLGLNRTQEREIIYVLFHCCLNEKDFNPFYAYLSNKFCTFDRRFAITVQFTMWDKFKEIDNMEKTARCNLGHLLAHLLLSKALSLSVFKVIDFGMESKKTIRLLVQVMTEILTSPSIATVQEMFERIAPSPKLKALRQGLQVFMHINIKGENVKGTPPTQLQERIDKAEFAMFSHHSAKPDL